MAITDFFCRIWNLIPEITEQNFSEKLVFRQKIVNEKLNLVKIHTEFSKRGKLRKMNYQKRKSSKIIELFRRYN